MSLITKRMEVTSIVRLFEEFERIKLLLLTEEQMKELESDKSQLFN